MRTLVTHYQPISALQQQTAQQKPHPTSARSYAQLVRPTKTPGILIRFLSRAPLLTVYTFSSQLLDTKRSQAPSKPKKQHKRKRTTHNKKNENWISRTGRHLQLKLGSRDVKVASDHKKPRLLLHRSVINHVYVCMCMCVCTGTFRRMKKQATCVGIFKRIYLTNAAATR